VLVASEAEQKRYVPRYDDGGKATQISLDLCHVEGSGYHTSLADAEMKDK
jgi:hypothetical protein